MKYSVTEIVHNQFPKFNADDIAQKLTNKHFNSKKSKYFQKTKDDILSEWNVNKNEACEKGTQLHQDIEYTYNNIPVYNDSKEYTLFEKFKNDYNDLKPFRTEWEVCYEDKNLAGSIDMVFENSDGSYSIYDWKRSKKIEKMNNFEFGNGELDHLPNSNFWLYSLQLNTYKYILENVYDFPIKDLHLVILHPNNDTYIVMECPNLQNEVKYMLSTI